MGRASEQKTIFITGAASGIGAETARFFVERGWYCGLYDINQEGLADLAGSLGPENCHTAYLDVRDRTGWKAAIRGFSEATRGQMHVLLNNAGAGHHGWFEGISSEDNDRVIDVNIKGVINGIQAALPLLKATSGACIVNMASVAGMVGAPRLAVYSATKFAVRGLTEALDAEFRDLGIRTKCIMPWFIDTPLLDTGKAQGVVAQNTADALRASGINVFPASIVAERVWQAINGKDIHYMAGKDAERVRFMARWMPDRLARMARRRVPPRN